MLILQCVGAALLLLAYLGLHGRMWNDLSNQYLALNIIGAGMLATTAWIQAQWGFAVLNTIWCLAGVRSAITLSGRIS